MKLLILTALLTTTLTAQAGPVYNINTHTERSLPPWRSNALPKQRQGAAEGWREVVPHVAPSGMVQVVSTRQIIVTNDAAVEVYHTITEAEYAAAVQAETRAQLQAAVDSAGPLIRALQANLVQLGHSLPADANEVIAAVMEASLTGQLTTAQIEAKHDAIAVYFILDKKEVDNDAVNAVWQYMKATGQDVVPE